MEVRYQILKPLPPKKTGSLPIYIIIGVFVRILSRNWYGPFENNKNHEDKNC